MPNQLEEWYLQIPICTRIYLTATVGLTLAEQMELVTQYDLFYTYNYAFTRKQYWRVVTTFLFLGRLSLDWMLSMYFIERHWRDLEEGSYLTRPADFAWMLILMCAVLLAVSPYMGTLFLGHMLVTALTYVWSRHYSYTFINIMGLFNISASYFPWCMIGFSLLVENRWPVPELAAIGVGHLFWFLGEEWPRRAESGGAHVLRAPKFLRKLMSQEDAPAPAAADSRHDDLDDLSEDDGFGAAAAEHSDGGGGDEEEDEEESETYGGPFNPADTRDDSSLHQRAAYARELDD
ncbi:hypothetical protein LPJ72_004332 [Coemansia sp. Benny D160-2]|nr:hypothetical protein LPJ72_004332 [Coemansia sp. Benny D160-2]